MTYTEASDRVLAEQIGWTLLISVSCSISLQPLPATISPSKAFVASRFRHGVITYRIRVSRMARRRCTLGWRVKTRGKCGEVDTWDFSWLLCAGRSVLKSSVDFFLPILRPHIFFLLHHNFLQSHRGSYTCSKIKTHANIVYCYVPAGNFDHVSKFYSPVKGHIYLHYKYKLLYS